MPPDGKQILSELSSIFVIDYRATRYFKKSPDVIVNQIITLYYFPSWFMGFYYVPRVVSFYFCTFGCNDLLQLFIS